MTPDSSESLCFTNVSLRHILLVAAICSLSVMAIVLIITTMITRKVPTFAILLDYVWIGFGAFLTIAIIVPIAMYIERKYQVLARRDSNDAGELSKGRSEKE